MTGEKLSRFEYKVGDQFPVKNEEELPEGVDYIDQQEIQTNVGTFVFDKSKNFRDGYRRWYCKEAGLIVTTVIGYGNTIARIDTPESFGLPKNGQSHPDFIEGVKRWKTNINP